MMVVVVVMGRSLAAADSGRQGRRVIALVDARRGGRAPGRRRVRVVVVVVATGGGKRWGQRRACQGRHVAGVAVGDFVNQEHVGRRAGQ